MSRCIPILVITSPTSSTSSQPKSVPTPSHSSAKPSLPAPIPPSLLTYTKQPTDQPSLYPTTELSTLPTCLYSNSTTDYVATSPANFATKSCQPTVEPNLKRTSQKFLSFNLLFLLACNTFSLTYYCSLRLLRLISSLSKPIYLSNLHANIQQQQRCHGLLAIITSLVFWIYNLPLQSLRFSYSFCQLYISQQWRLANATLNSIQSCD